MKFGESLSEGLVQEWKEQYVDYKQGKEKIKRISKLMGQLDSGKAPTDTTPLLEPLDEGQAYVPELNSESRSVDNRSNGEAEHKNRTSMRRRTSVFGFSLRPVADDLKAEKQGFAAWLDHELRRVEAFYREREKDVYYRFLILEDQFHQLREQKSASMQKSGHMDSSREGGTRGDQLGTQLHRWNLYLDRMVEPLARYDFPSLPSMKFMKSAKKTEKLDFDPNYRENKIRNNDVDSEDESITSLDLASSLYESHSRSETERANSSGMARTNSSGMARTNSSGMARTTSRVGADTSGEAESIEREMSAVERERDSREVDRDLREAGSIKMYHRRGKRDYEQKPKHNVPYFYARKRLKEALIEHYRSIALVKSYRIMNRTALRKIVKKYDKATQSSMLKPFLSKIDQDSYFQTSQILDQMSARVEDLFLMFFSSEHTEKKQGLERLKAVTYTLSNSNIRTKSFHESVFASGLMIGLSVPFFAMGLYQALHMSPSNVVQYAERRYLLQVWAGFLLVLLALYFVGINFVVYARYKVNYKFIFEFNLATALDFRQMFLLPSVGLVLMSVCGWLSFMDFWPSQLPARTWPLIYLALMLGIYLWPGHQLYASSREWLQIALWRIVCSGFYPVEFRDFYLGDILCSLTYSLGNLAFFLCLYADKWKHLLGGRSGRLAVPASSARCGSSHSHSMGFLTALPSIWRFLQCLRRFMDSGDAFPHLANMTKYLVGAFYYCFLSLWRIHRTSPYRAGFITVASVNSVFCALWDIIMDWSLGQSGSQHWLLRDNLFLGRPAYYYTAVVVDVILRFQWIFYAFFSSQIQQSAVTSFCIALAELIRRFVWMFFRMENEHCTNVYLFRASRENSLPYVTSTRVEKAISRLVDLKYPARDADSANADSANADSANADSANADESENADKLRDADKSANADKVRDADELERNTHRDSAHGSTGSTRGSTAVEERKSMAQVVSEVVRRKSTFQTISEALNKAHIRDFQRKRLNVQEDSEDDDDDDERAQSL